MKSLKNQSGVAVLELVLIVVVLAIIGFTGYKVYHSKKSVDDTVKESSSQTTKTSDEAAPISSAADLDNAEKSLEAVNPDDSSSEVSELESEMSEF